MVKNEPLDPARTYTLTSHKYLIKNGGDGFNMFEDNVIIQDEFMLDYTALINYLVNDYPARVQEYADPWGDGRITTVK